jgi:hypothetical protein
MKHDLLTLNNDREEIRVWDAATGAEYLTIKGSAAQWDLSPDGRSLASVPSQNGAMTVREDVCEGYKRSP